MKEINVLDLFIKLKEKKIILLDVRENYELKIAEISGAVKIPMMQIPSKISELNKEDVFAVMCHSGIRSAQVCQFLDSKGFIAYNVLGGINQWSEEVDSNIKKY